MHMLQARIYTLNLLNVQWREGWSKAFYATVKYPKVFQGLGQFGELYLIRLQPDAQPHAVFTPRRVPLTVNTALK